MYGVRRAFGYWEKCDRKSFSLSRMSCKVSHSKGGGVPRVQSFCRALPLWSKQARNWDGRPSKAFLLPNPTREQYSKPNYIRLEARKRYEICHVYGGRAFRYSLKAYDWAQNKSRRMCIYIRSKKKQGGNRRRLRPRAETCAMRGENLWPKKKFRARPCSSRRQGAEKAQFKRAQEQYQKSHKIAQKYRNQNPK